MSDNVVDISSKRDEARHKRKEQRMDQMKDRFEKPCPQKKPIRRKSC
ncbi:hypothetical protein [Aliamphritea spongicola]|nr:hypothetical protein [Aliamphritea spongicola]